MALDTRFPAGMTRFFGLAEAACIRKENDHQITVK
jgi:hypothetical protein